MYTLNINLAKVPGAYIATLTDGQRAVILPSSCVFIPDDQQPDKPVASLAVDVFVGLPNQFGKTCSVKPHYREAVIEKMTDAERNAIPYIGSGK